MLYRERLGNLDNWQLLKVQNLIIQTLFIKTFHQIGKTTSKSPFPFNTFTIYTNLPISGLTWENVPLQQHGSDWYHLIIFLAIELNWLPTNIRRGTKHCLVKTLSGNILNATTNAWYKHFNRLLKRMQNTWIAFVSLNFTTDSEKSNQQSIWIFSYSFDFRLYPFHTHTQKKVDSTYAANFCNWRHLSNLKLIVQQIPTSSQWLASHKKSVRLTRETFIITLLFHFSATNKLINFNTFQMYKFYKAILYSPMNEQIYTRFFFISFFYGRWKIEAFLCGRNILYENYNIVTE